MATHWLQKYFKDCAFLFTLIVALQVGLMLSFESDSLHDYNSMRLMSGICLCLCLLDPEDPLKVPPKNATLDMLFKINFFIGVRTNPNERVSSNLV